MARPAIELSANAQPDGKTGVKALVWESGAYNFRRASGLAGKLEVPALPPPWELSGAWEVHFQPNRGAPEKITMDGPSDWAKNPDPGIQHFSGTATYVKTFTVPEQMLEARQKFPLTPALSPGRGGNAGSPTANEGKGGSTMPARLRLNLDLGRVAVMAEVKVNGQDFGIWWKPPFRADITEALKPGENRLEIKVVNLWINRMIGDEQLAEDSARNPNGTLKEWPQWVNEGKSSPTGRSTFTSWRLWKKDSPLQESGLLGPVRLVSAWEETIGSEPRQHAGRGTGEAAKAPNSNIQHPDKLQAPRSKNQNSEAKGNVWPSFTTSTHYE
jgi:hypothetical protein